MVAKSDRITELQELKSLLVEWGYAEDKAKNMAIMLIFGPIEAMIPSLEEFQAL